MNGGIDPRRRIFIKMNEREKSYLDDLIEARRMIRGFKGIVIGLLILNGIQFVLIILLILRG